MPDRGNRYRYLVTVIWDYLLTLRMEIDAIWRGKITVASLLFIGNRYIALVLVTAYLHISLPGVSSDS